MLQLQWAHNSMGDTSKSKVTLKHCSNNNNENKPNIVPAYSTFG